MSDAPVASESDSLRDRVAELEQELAEAREDARLGWATVADLRAGRPS